MSQMIVKIVGASRGSFKNDDDKTQSYASVYVLENLKADANRDLESVGMRSDKYSATPDVFATIKAAKLPSDFICEIETSTSAQKGTRIKLLSAQPFPPQSART